MKKRSKPLLSICLILINLILCSIPCTAASACSLTVLLEDSEKKAIDGLEVYAIRIADGNGSDYYPATGFEDSGISIAAIVNNPSAANAKKIFEFAKENEISAVSTVSQAGKAEFGQLDPGIWLVHCGEGGTHSFNPYIVFLPYESDGKPQYEIFSAPKTDINTPDDKSIYVLKKWDDKNDAAKKRPKAVTADLKRNGTVIDSVILHAGNGWSHTFTALPKEGKYAISERPVEKYSVQYSGDSENGFIITNTYTDERLPQTGQLWWPIILLSVAGVAFVLLGILELGARKNGKKEK